MPLKQLLIRNDTITKWPSRHVRSCDKSTEVLWRAHLQSPKSWNKMFCRTSPGAIGCLNAAMSSSWSSISSSSASPPPSVSYWLSPSAVRPLLLTAGITDFLLPAPFRRSSTNVPIIMGRLPFNSPPFWSISSRNCSNKNAALIKKFPDIRMHQPP